jgi:3-oxoacyl-[acyl-carrier protein] reductase
MYRVRQAATAVNAVSLGPIQTGWLDPDLEEAAARNTPLSRFGRPADTAAMILPLASAS